MKTLKTLLTRSSGRNGRAMHRPHRVRWAAPRLQALEDRVAPATLTVTNLLDSGPGSLRAEIGLAHNGDTVTFAAGLRGTITLTTGELQLHTSVTVQGPGASQITVSGHNLYRVFDVFAGVTATLSGLTITAGTESATSGGGGGIYDGGTLTVSNCTVSGNSGIHGGGIYVSASGATLTVNNSTLSGNKATVVGGGIYSMGTCIFNNSTVSGNTAQHDGGGVDNVGSLTAIGCTFSGNTSYARGGGIATWFQATLTNCTLASNTAGTLSAGLELDSGGATLTSCTVANNQAVIAGGGIAVQSNYPFAPDPSPVLLRNTIVASNTAHSNGASDILSDIRTGGADSRSAYNLIGTGGAGGLINGMNHNRVGVSSPGLGALANNGGPTWTMAVQTGSPALGTGDPTLAGTTDQRGVIRGSPVTIGAFQGSPFSPSGGPGGASPAVTRLGKPGSLTTTGGEGWSVSVSPAGSAVPAPVVLTPGWAGTATGTAAPAGSGLSWMPTAPAVSADLADALFGLDDPFAG